MTKTVADLRRLLEVTELMPGMFSGWTPDSGRPQIFGGQLAGQAIAAATRTVPDSRALHSLHGYFLRRGDMQEPVHYKVEDLHEGRSFSARRVMAYQGEQSIFHALCSFGDEGNGVLSHQEPMPDAPPPESLDRLSDRLRFDPTLAIPGLREWGGFDVRWVGDPRHGVTPDEGRVTRNQIWVRAIERLPDDPKLHASGLVYLSDLALLVAMRQPNGVAAADPRLRIFSVGHSMWIHRPARIDEWLLYDQTSPTGARNLCLAQGRLFTREGILVASVVQEGLSRWSG